ncbi:3-hydroxyacyl-CoA dehydrogenase NAD-binding domain-containing protein [Paenirhodobacter enshiensis]|uniref:3-hydroxyacyl-CoA dehydrogenase NAD-binding domain-containing protein n=1 Tax=Paenirhodobacter enshiensis TaxID=1105367 RepID=UPI001B804A4E|nr:3-hydroxyacyl-CoA dehydrogenase NAD-binding domain-containing protein [Paenirhodobacter enshiensis]
MAKQTGGVAMAPDSAIDVPRDDKTGPVGYDVRDGVAVLTLDAPPVNALSAALRAALRAALARANADPAVRAVVVTGAGKLFSAGADITEFGKPARDPALPEVLAAIEASAKPVVAAVTGAALGGGCELTLACHARVAGRRASFGLPEVRLGLIPGAGGTQRLPRLIGPVAAFETMLSGRSLDAGAAKTAGLAEAVADDPLPRACALARDLAAAGTWPVTSAHPVAADAGTRAALSRATEEAMRRHGALSNTAALIRATEAALALPFAEGLALERAEFAALISSPQARALRHVFFAERQAAKVPGLDAATPTRPVARVAVIGAGTMGGGIATAFANAGIAVTLIETSDELLSRGIERIRAGYATSVRRGSVSENSAEAALAQISGAVGLQAVAGADLVIEAAFEDMAVKRAIFAEIGRAAGPGAILATNTSYLDVDEIAAASGRAGDVLGLHFFSPANVMRLLEVVRGGATRPEVLATAMALAKRIGKLAVVSGVGFGFIGNRMLAARTRAAERLLLAGNPPGRIDAAVTGFGFRMGSFAMTDLAGLDIGWRARKAFGGFAPVADRLAEMGRLGQKTGRGFYLYPEGARTGTADPEVADLAMTLGRELGIAPETLDAAAMTERLFLPMVNEAARILDEGIAARASDIDLVWINGYGWPVWTGGPMAWADDIGLRTVVAKLDAQARQLNLPELAPAPLLRRLAAEGRGFAGFDAERRAEGRA